MTVSSRWDLLAELAAKRGRRVHLYVVEADAPLVSGPDVYTERDARELAAILGQLQGHIADLKQIREARRERRLALARVRNKAWCAVNRRRKAAAP
jgi:hypothetical protein